MYKAFNDLPCLGHCHAPATRVPRRKTFILLLTLIFLQVPASTFAQKITINVKSASLENVFKQLRRQSGYNFLYDIDLLEKAKPVTLSMKAAALGDVLRECFKDQPLTYVIDNNTVIVRPLPASKKISAEEETVPLQAADHTPTVSQATPEINNAPKDVIVTGKITDAKGDPLQGVSVSLKGSNTGASSSNAGLYTIKITGDRPLLIFSYVGYVTQEVPVIGRTRINITLAEEQLALTEVVVNGYTSQKRQDVTAAISSVSGRELLRAPVTNVTQALAGLVPGLVVQQSQGRPGFNTANLYIRGRVSTSSTALIIVDGVERSSFGDIDPNEIESINILKDAASTALYGLKGANGVFVITTKKGKEGNAKLTFTNNLGYVTPTKRPEILRAYESAMIYTEAQNNVGETRTWTDADLETFKNKTGDPLLYPDIDWYSELVRDHWFQNQQNLTVSGGTKKVKYFTSFGHQFEDGNFKKYKTPLNYSTTPSYTRYNFRARLSFDITNSTNFEVNLGGRNEHRYSPQGMSQHNDPAGVVSNGIEGLVGRSLKIASWGMPFFPEYTNASDPRTIALDATYNHIVNMALLGINTINPYASLIYGGYAFTDNSIAESIFTINQKLDFLTKGFSVKAQFGYDANFSTGKLQRGSVGYFNLNRTTLELSPYNSTYNDFLGSPTYTRTGFNKTNLQLFINYAAAFGSHNISGNIIGQRELQGATAATAPYANQGVIAQVTYNYGGRYFITGSGTYNGSENYAAGYRYGFFPSVSAGYNIANEKFFNLTWVNMLKIRGSVGRVGIPSPGTGRFYYQDAFGAGTSMAFGNPSSAFSAPTYTQTQYGNPEVSFEESLKRNLGIDVSLFNSQFNFTADLFDDRRSRILTSRNNTSFATYGATVPNINYGVNYNYGYELSASFQSRRNKFTYSISGNFAFARNKREVLDEAPGTLPNLKATGTPIGTYFGYHTLGFYASDHDIQNSPVNLLTSVKSIPGDLKFEDINGDNQITSLDRIPIGRPSIPEYTAGLNLQAGYKGFQVTAMFNAVNNVSSDLVFYGGGLNQYYKPMLGRWRPNHPNATWPSVRPGLAPNPNENVNDFFLQNAAYIKLRNIQLAYTLPRSLTQKIRFSNITFILSGQNLFTWTNFYGVDPENNIVGGTYNYNVTVIPTTKIVNFGLTASF
jgi:TonB-linked SusC/RagA family outer membrane protein